MVCQSKRRKEFMDLLKSKVLTLGHKTQQLKAEIASLRSQVDELTGRVNNLETEVTQVVDKMIFRRVLTVFQSKAARYVHPIAFVDAAKKFKAGYMKAPALPSLAIKGGLLSQQRLAALNTELTKHKLVAVDDIDWGMEVGFLAEQGNVVAYDVEHKTLEEALKRNAATAEAEVVNKLMPVIQWLEAQPDVKDGGALVLPQLL